MQSSYEHLNVQGKTTYTDQNNYAQSLLALPAKENFAGTLSDLRIFELDQEELKNFLERAEYFKPTNLTFSKNERVFTLLDAAAYVPTRTLDLSKTKPDFVVFSSYKVFGFPTSVGVMVARMDALDELSKRYYGGGSTVYSLAEEVLPVKSVLRFEDGTHDFLGIAALQFGFEALNRVGGTEKITKWVSFLTDTGKRLLREVVHENSSSAVKIYLDKLGRSDGIIAFNLVHKDGTVAGYSETLDYLTKRKIQLRAGCNCNPGACADALGLTESVFEKAYAMKENCGDEIDVVDGAVVGALRASLGYWNTVEDIRRLVDVVRAWTHDDDVQ